MNSTNQLHSSWRCVTCRLVLIATLCLINGCGQSFHVPEKVLAGNHVFATWSKDEPKPQLLHIVIVPKGVAMPPYSASQYDRYEGLQRRKIPTGLHLTPGAVYLNGVRNAATDGSRVFVVSQAGGLITVPLSDGELSPLRDPGFEQLTKLAAWDTSIALAIKSASSSPRQLSAAVATQPAQNN